MATTKQRRPYGTGAIWFDERSGLYVGTVELARKPGQPRRRRWLKDKSKTNLEKRLAALRVTQDKGQSIEPQRETVKGWADHWLTNIKGRSVARMSLNTYKGALVYLTDALGDRRLNQVTPEDMDQLFGDMFEAGLSSWTVAKVRKISSMLFKAAEGRGKVSTNPVQFTEPVRVEPSNDGLTPEQTFTVLKAAQGDRLEALAFVLLMLGLRRSEVRALSWSDVNLNLGELIVRKSKTEAGERTIDLPPVVVDCLRAYRRRQAEDRLALGTAWGGSTRVFTTAHGFDLGDRGLTIWWHGLTERAGVGVRRLHAARHSAAILMLEQGAPLEVVQKVLGHASLAITNDLYGRYAKRRTFLAASAVDQWWQTEQEAVV